MSKIKNGGLDQYGAEPFEQQQFGTAGVEGVNTYLPRPLGGSSQDYSQPVENAPYPAVGKQGASHLYLGASNSLAPALDKWDTQSLTHPDYLICREPQFIASEIFDLYVSNTKSKRTGRVGVSE